MLHFQKEPDMRTRSTALVLLPALLLGLAGCGTSARSRRYLDQQMDMGSIRTVAVMPLTNLSRDNQAADRVREVFANMLLATGALYVIPVGEVNRVVGRVGVASMATPSVEEVTRLGPALKVDGLFVGVLKEYGEVRSGSASGMAISLTMQLIETGTGKVVWSGSTTQGGVTAMDRLFGGGGAPMNDITEAACNDLLDQLFK
jgi:polysaccharide biosynthesis protein PelC